MKPHIWEPQFTKPTAKQVGPGDLCFAFDIENQDWMFAEGREVRNEWGKQFSAWVEMPPAPVKPVRWTVEEREGTNYIDLKSRDKDGVASTGHWNDMGITRSQLLSGLRAMADKLNEVAP